MPTNEARIFGLSPKDLNSIFKYLPKKRFTNAAKIDQIHGPAQPGRQFRNQGNLLNRGQATSGSYSDIQVARFSRLAGCERSEHDRKANVWNNIQCIDDGFFCHGIQRRHTPILADTSAHRSLADFVPAQTLGGDGNFTRCEGGLRDPAKARGGGA